MVPERCCPGPPRQGDLAVAVSTLAVAALFRPLLAWTRHAIDRRFNRPRYDRGREVGRFAERVRDDIGLDELTANLLTVVSHTMQPTSAGVWMRLPSHDQQELAVPNLTNRPAIASTRR
jgi:hypothetical protein